ncbi:MAG TPA: DUF1501 domain-containing protein [Planctomycetota bacterium]|nr:DUF1501 domain-containing protein [Planctomycetota bacterium]
MRPTSGTRCCSGPVSRRSFLEIGALSVLGMGMSDLLRAEEASKHSSRKSKEKSVIFIWLHGGASQMETYDMKPEAPLEYRGPLAPIKTNVNGIEVCELMPLHAKCADKYSLIRSIHHEFNDHGGGGKRFMTGRIPASPVGSENDAPSVICIANKMLANPNQAMPPCVVEMNGTNLGGYSFDAAYLGPSTSPFIVSGDPSQPTFKVQNIGLNPEMETRLEDRLRLLSGMDKLRRDVDQSGLMDAMDHFSQRAMQMLTSPKVREAFDLSKEPDAIKNRYGRHLWGQRALLGRRLVEAGSRFVTMNWERPTEKTPKDCCGNWDQHAVNCDLFADARWRMPYYDQALTALIEDIHARNMQDDVMIICTGEFGRTPKISTAVGTQTGRVQPGRDHYPQAMSLLVSGGGSRGGQIIGATNGKGEYPVERPLSPNDLWATVYRHLGIDYEISFPDYQGRPMPILPFGEPITELLPAQS